jgi:hypothetical protein
VETIFLLRKDTSTHSISIISMLALHTTSQGRRYFEFRRDRFLGIKNHQGGLNDNKDKSDGKVFEVVNSRRCPVTTIENFLSHLHPVKELGLAYSSVHEKCPPSFRNVHHTRYGIAIVPLANAVWPT